VSIYLTVAGIAGSKDAPAIGAAGLSVVLALVARAGVRAALFFAWTADVLEAASQGFNFLFVSGFLALRKF
jgi:hypothetical protein